MCCRALKSIKADILYLPDIPDQSGIQDALAEKYEKKIRWTEQASSYRIPEADITLFSAETGKDDNESSQCVLFQPENCDILITGDRGSTGERALLQQTTLPELEILVVGHHGANLLKEAVNRRQRLCEVL